MKISQRHEFILDCLKESAYVDVSYLTESLDVSEMTIRRDLSKLEEEKQLLRVYGGARRIPLHTYEASLDNRLLENRKEKEAIAKYAASLVDDGDIISMEASSTVYFMVEHLQDKNITVITNNLSVAIGFSKSKTVKVVLLGGVLKKSSLYVYGYDALNSIEKYNMNKAFISSSSLSVERGLMNVNAHEGETKKAIIKSAQKSYLLMDTSKFGKVSYYNVVSLKKLDYLIINNDVFNKDTIDVLNYCKDNSIKVHICDK
jgi:DeoR family transcriptional regulator, fructose operon transcriptional repressor